MSQCRDCKAPIRFAITAKGRRMPLDTTPNEASGNVRITKRHGEAYAEVLGPDAARMARMRGEELHTPHAATCRVGRRSRARR